VSDGTFGIEIAAWCGQAIVESKDACRLVSMKVGTAVVPATPADKGITRNNWFASIMAPSEETTSDADPSGSQAISRVNETAKSWDPTKGPMYITNNRPAAVVMELGLYPNPPKLGTYLRRGQAKRGRVGPGYFKFSVGGFSEEALRGFVDVTLNALRGEL